MGVLRCGSNSKILSFFKRKLIKISFVNRIYKYRYKRKWRKKNKLNYTIPLSYPPLKLVEIGRGTYGGIMVYNTPRDAKLIIGNYCSIADSVVFLLSLEHPLGLLSTYPFKSKIFGNSEATSKGDIIIGDDVWIGYGAIVLSGVKVGQGAVIAAGAVVTKDIPPYAIVAGVPAKIVRYRFESEIIEDLLKIDWSIIELDDIRENLSVFYEHITIDNIHAILKVIREISGKTKQKSLEHF